MEGAEDRGTGVLIWAENWTGFNAKDLRLTIAGQSQKFYNS